MEMTPHLPPRPGMLSLLGICWDENSSYLRGCAEAPPLIRQALRSASANLCAENGRDLDGDPALWDAGDLYPQTGVAGVEQIEQTVARLLQNGGRVLCLGGDHAVTYPILRAHAARLGRLNILHLDAHPDLYDEYDGNRYSHACPFARILEEGLVSNLVQVGIRTMTPHQRQQAERFGVQVMEMRSWQPDAPLPLAGPLYISVDLDVLDPAFVPGVSHHEPGGMSTRQLLGIFHTLKVPVIGADLVEYNPTRDVQGLTAMTAAKILKELCALLLENLHA